MYTIQKTDSFDHWLNQLRDQVALARIIQRLKMLEAGHWGDRKYLGSGISELRIHFSGGYRLYYFQSGHDIIVLLCGGIKSSQKSDIAKATLLAKTVREQL
jgi:putative addiction module killer protein